MPAAFVQSTTGAIANATSCVTDAFGTTTGRFIGVVICCTGGAVTVNSVTDTAGNTYTKVMSRATQFSVATLDIWYAANATGHATNQITVNINTALNIVVAAVEYSGVAIASPFDVAVSNTGSDASPTSTATSTTTQANELVLGGVATSTTETNTLTLGSGYSNLITRWINDSRAGQESKVVTATGAYSATFSLASSAYWACGCATFKEAAAVADPPWPRRRSPNYRR